MGLRKTNQILGILLVIGCLVVGSMNFKRIKSFLTNGHPMSVSQSLNKFCEIVTQVYEQDALEAEERQTLVIEKVNEAALHRKVQNMITALADAPQDERDGAWYFAGKELDPDWTCPYFAGKIDSL